MKTKSRKGLTLLELLMVLVILAAVAGIVIPIAANVITRAHGSTGATNIAEIAKAIQQHPVLHNEPANLFDSLIDDAGTIVEDVDGNPLGGTGLALEDLSDASANDARIIDALNDIGITESMEHEANSTNKTFAPYSGNTIPIDNTGSVVVLTVDGVASLGLNPLGTNVVAYVAVGLGAESTLIGRSILNAPVHFPEQGESVADVYSRFLLIYAIPANGPARLAAVAAAHEDGLSNLNTHLLEYYATQE